MVRDSQGNEITTGMHLQTPCGRVIEVMGVREQDGDDGMIYHAETSTVVPNDTPLTSEIPLSQRPITNAGVNTVVWGW